MVPAFVLFILFAEVSLLAFGGISAVLPEMRRQIVDTHHWIGPHEFSALYALAQAAPGPNAMVVTLLGWHLGGWKGALAATAGIFGPSAVITVTAMRLWTRFQKAAWRNRVQAGLIPVTVGLVASSALQIAEAADNAWLLVAITVVVTGLLLRSKIHPLLLLAGGTVVGLIGLH